MTIFVLPTSFYYYQIDHNVHIRLKAISCVYGNIIMSCMSSRCDHFFVRPYVTEIRPFTCIKSRNKQADRKRNDNILIFWIHLNNKYWFCYLVSVTARRIMTVAVFTFVIICIQRPNEQRITTNYVKFMLKLKSRVLARWRKVSVGCGSDNMLHYYDLCSL